jgi:hypothetical protein
MGKAMLSAHRIHTDIPVQVQGRTQKGHVWTYVADDDLVVFRYTPRRKSDGPREFLRGYKGYVQANAANLYDRLSADGGDQGAVEVGLLGARATPLLRGTGDGGRRHRLARCRPLGASPTSACRTGSRNGRASGQRALSSVNVVFFTPFRLLTLC